MSMACRRLVPPGLGRSLVIAMAIAALGPAAATAAPTITTGPAYSGGSTESQLTATFQDEGCAPKVSYDIGTTPLEQGGYQTVDSGAFNGGGYGASTSQQTDYTNVFNLVAGTIYFYRASVEELCNGASSGPSTSGSQLCFQQQTGNKKKLFFHTTLFIPHYKCSGASP